MVISNMHPTPRREKKKSARTLAKELDKAIRDNMKLALLCQAQGTVLGQIQIAANAAARQLLKTFQPLNTKVLLATFNKISLLCGKSKEFVDRNSDPDPGDAGATGEDKGPK